MANTPNIRFQGFTDDWEQRKLSEVAEIVGGGTPSTNIPEYWDGDIDWYAPAEINDQIYVDGSERKITKLGLEKSSAKILPADKTVLFTSRAGIGKTAILRRSGATNQGFQSMVLNDETNPYFVFSMSKFIKEEAERVASGSTFAEVSGKMLGNLTFMFPTKQEQDKIGEYFSNLDNLITLHQRKCDEMKKMKKFMLQKMFPKNGAKNPEIRFDGFTDDWEQRKLGEVSERVQGNDGRMGLPTLTISAANGWMSQEARFSGNIAGKEQKNYTLLHKGELSYNHGNSKLAKYGTVFSLETYEEALVPRVYHSFRMTEGDASFIEYYFATKIPDRELAKLISSGARMDGLLNIGFDEFMGININLPSIKEQERISDYLRSLDNLITLHQRKAENLKNLKKYMLQNMFV